MLDKKKTITYSLDKLTGNARIGTPQANYQHHHQLASAKLNILLNIKQALNMFFFYILKQFLNINQFYAARRVERREKYLPFIYIIYLS